MADQIDSNAAELRPKAERLQRAKTDPTNAERQRRFKERRKQRQLAIVTEPPPAAVTEERPPVVTDPGNAGVPAAMDRLTVTRPMVAPRNGVTVAHPADRAADAARSAASVALAEPATPRIEVLPPRYRTWSAIGRAGVGLAIVATGAWIAYTSMRGNSWFGHSLTPDQTAGDIYSQLSVAAEVLACLIPTGIRFYAQDGERWTALRGWALMAVALTVVFFAAGGFAVTNINSGIEARAERETPAMRDLRTQIAGLDKSITRANGKLETERQGVKADADPQAAALGISSATLHLIQAGAMVVLCLASGLFISFGAGLIWPQRKQ